MRFLHNNSIHSFISNSGVPFTCLTCTESIRSRAFGGCNGHCPCGRCSCLPNECRPCPEPPEPEVFPYVVNYYAGSIQPANLLGSVSGTGILGGFIAADLFLFAPSGYQVPGIRSGAEFISAIPENNVVNVLYRQLV